jgi:exosortase B
MATAAPLPRGQASDWLIVLGGFLAMYLPIYWWAVNTIWQTDSQAHGAIILLVVVWLFWQQMPALLATPCAPARPAGWAAFMLGLLLYLVGRTLHISVIELASQIPVILGVLLVLRGWAAVRAAWFPIVFAVFMVPVPGFLVDAITGPLKQWISAITENSLYAVGYPIARSGVMLSIGQYQLLVADACSGLHSMFSLSALGALYMYIAGRASRTHNAVMLLSILPVAFTANLVRVIVLVLITYHFGDAAGQGFLHGAAGIMLLIVALSILMGLDSILARLVGPFQKTSPR